MFQRHRMILEGRIQVGLGKMPCITRLRKEAEIRQLQGFDNTGNLPDPENIGLPLIQGMKKHRSGKHDGDAKQKQAIARFPQGKPGSAGCFMEITANQVF